jgi:hypothetical protein
MFAKTTDEFAEISEDDLGAVLDLLSDIRSACRAEQIPEADRLRAIDHAAEVAYLAADAPDLAGDSVAAAREFLQQFVLGGWQADVL